MTIDPLLFSILLISGCVGMFLFGFFTGIVVGGGETISIKNGNEDHSWVEVQNDDDPEEEEQQGWRTGDLN